MRYLLKTDGIEFEVSKTAVPKMEPNGPQKIDHVTKLPVWQVQVVTYTNEMEGSEALIVSVPSQTAPSVKWRQSVQVVDLEMIPWSQKDRRTGDIRSGVSFRAAEIRPADGSAPLAV